MHIIDQLVLHTHKHTHTFAKPSTYIHTHTYIWYRSIKPAHWENRKKMWDKIKQQQQQQQQQKQQQKQPKTEVAKMAKAPRRFNVIMHKEII